ncbi:MAG: N-acetylmuramoyl-L-alanine amidase, partial [Ferruginibacter sp.]
LDAGHGGKDFGAASLDGKVTEKDMALSIVQKIKALNNNADINIVLTRNTDVYSSPKDKADFTNAQKPDLFISFHIDASNSPDSSTYHSGLSTWVSKDAYSNSSKSKLFASAILQEFNINYDLPVFDQPNQSENGIWVLQSANCPAVLIEAGFITNQKDLKYLRTAEAKETIAKNVLAAIEKYAVQIGSNITITDPVIKDTVPVAVNKKTSQLPANTLYVLDGKIQTNAFKLNSISPNNIESINVLKNKMAIDKYGNRAANGVIEITMKKKKIETNAIFNTDNDKIFTKVENEPKFPGGEPAWRRFLIENLNPSIPVDNGAPEGTYKVIVKFIVNKDGSVSNVHAETKFGYGMDSVAVAVIKKVSKWEPAKQNGNIVTAYKKQPITFVIQEQ